ncbi:MAG: metallophosphoesterase [Brevundimonas sp.]
MISKYREAFERTGSYRAAARSLGVHHDTVRKALQIENLRAPEGDPFIIAKQNTLRNGKGEVIQTWTTTVPTATALRDNLEELIETFRAQVSPLKPIDKSPKHCLKDLLAIYPVGDPHFGLKSWAEEVGEDFDTDIARDDLCGAIDKLVEVTPQAETALLLILGDLTHADDETAATPASRNKLDVSDRHARVIRVALDALIYSVRRLLTHHKKVHVWLTRGNHDPQSSYAIALCLDAFFRADPRVEVNIEPGMFKYMRWGNNLIGSTHGHAAKGKDLTSIMAVDRREDWGLTEHHFWLVGHIHHKTKETNGATIESFNTLAASDAWHHGAGYRSKRRLESIILHIEHGDVERHAVDIAMIR